MKPIKPTNLQELRELIARENARLTPRMRDAAAYTLKHPHEVALSTLAVVSQNAKIAPAAFIRMTQALGFEGYGELQRLFREPLQKPKQPTFSERIRHYGGEQTVDDPQDPAEVLRAFSQANIVSLEHLRDEANALPLAQAIQMMQAARLVHVVGLRRSYAVAAYLAYALNRVGRAAVQITGLGGSIAEQTVAIDSRDLLIAISFPPYAQETLSVCEAAAKQGAKRLAISNSIMSPVASGADLVLEVFDAELLGFRSLTAAMCVAQALATGLAFRRRGGRARAGSAKDGPDLTDIDC